VSEIEVKPDPALAHYSTGDGAHETKIIITYNPYATPRMQRYAVIFEALLSQLRYMGHDKVGMLTDFVQDSLDQWESENG